MDLFSAFLRVVGCTHPTFTAAPGPPIWSDIRAVLELHGDWSPRMQEQLGELFLRIRELASTEAAEDRVDDG